MTFQFRLEGTAGAVDNNCDESSTGSGRRQFFVVRGGGCTGTVAHDGDTQFGQLLQMALAQDGNLIERLERASRGAERQLNRMESCRSASAVQHPRLHVR
jgi:hypothetical protein